MIYADNASTTKISDVVFEKMLPFLQEQYGNASNGYMFGMKAKKAIEHSRRQVAEIIGAESYEIIFNSGGTEGNSWIIQSVLKLFNGEPIHIVTSSIEHHSVLNTCRKLEEQGVAVTYLPVDSNGCVSVNDMTLALRPNTKLVSIMLANNEIGTIQPIAEIGKCLHQRGILFHTDAVQAIGHIPVNVKNLQVDFMTASAHKFNGAKGTGFIYKRSSLELPRLIFGGGQEVGRRAGTENVAGIVALGYALEENATDMAEIQKTLSILTKTTIVRLREVIPDIRINGENAERLSGMINITFPQASGEAMMHLLDLNGICVSTGSACNSGNDEPSHVLLALGLSEQQAKSSIRISYGRYNTIQDATAIISAIYNIYRKIRQVL